MSNERLNIFLNDLTELSLKHGLGINEGGVLYELESDDYERRYSCDEDSKIDFV
jgi:hypothetical protein